MGATIYRLDNQLRAGKRSRRDAYVVADDEAAALMELGQQIERQRPALPSEEDCRPP
jgi:hypothetical protein